MSDKLSNRSGTDGLTFRGYFGTALPLSSNPQA